MINKSCDWIHILFSANFADTIDKIITWITSITFTPKCNQTAEKMLHFGTINAFKLSIDWRN
jgi:hypothetical protein